MSFVSKLYYKTYVPAIKNWLYDNTQLETNFDTLLRTKTIRFDSEEAATEKED